MSAYSRVSPDGWEQGDDSSASSRVTPTGWEQVAATGGGVTVTLSNLSAISITSTAAQPQLDYTISGTPGAATTYFAVYPSGAATPTWLRANIGTNAGFSGTPTATGTDTSPPTATATDDEPTITWTGSLTPGTPYKLVALWDDGANSSAVFVGEVFDTYQTIHLSSPTVTAITSTTARGRVIATEYA